MENATVPCIRTGTGICHVYVDKSADLDMAVRIMVNAKTSRPSVCNAAEVCPGSSRGGCGFPAPAPDGCRGRTDRAWRGAGRTAAGQYRRGNHSGHPCGERDFDTEFPDYILAVRVVDSWRMPSRISRAIPPGTASAS